MAKRIKSIKCPQCGGTQYTPLKDDHYKCSSCSSEYFLDNDDININVTHKIEGNPIPDKKPVTFAIIGFAVFFAILIAFMIGKPSKRAFRDNPYGNIMLDVPVEVKGKMYLLTLSNSSSLEDKGSFYSFTDFDTKEIVKTEKLLNAGELKISIQDRNIRKFSNGDIYFIIDKQKLFKLDNDKMELKDVTVDMFEGDSLYKSGIANIDPFGGQHDGDCFKVMTNMGKEYYYYPRIKESFNQKELSFHSSSMETLRSNSKETIVYTFTKKKWESQEMEKVDETQLLKIVYQDNGGGPSSTYFNIQWETNGTLDWMWSSKPRIASYSNLTPGRLYFNPEIFYADKDYLLVKVTATASKESPFRLQRINTTTGELMWTIPLEVKNGRYIYYFDRALHADNRFVLKLNDEVSYLLVDDDGKNVLYFDMKDH